MRKQIEISIVDDTNMVWKSFLDKSIDEKTFHSTIIPWWQAYSHGTSCERLFRNIVKRELVDKTFVHTILPYDVHWYVYTTEYILQSSAPI